MEPSTAAYGGIWSIPSHQSTALVHADQQAPTVTSYLQKWTRESQVICVAHKFQAGPTYPSSAQVQHFGGSS